MGMTTGMQKDMVGGSVRIEWNVWKVVAIGGIIANHRHGKFLMWNNPNREVAPIVTMRVTLSAAKPLPMKRPCPSPRRVTKQKKNMKKQKLTVVPSNAYQIMQ